MFFWPCIIVLAFSNYQLNAQFLYSSTICILQYDPQHVSSSTLLIIRRTNCITTAAGIVTLCKQPHSMQVESRLHVEGIKPRYSVWGLGVRLNAHTLYPYGYVCSVLYILFSSHQLALPGYRDWGFSVFFPSLKGQCQGITR